MYYRARHYSPRLGRFVQKDPKDPMSDHYAYAYNNPSKFNDPLGLQGSPTSDPMGYATEQFNMICASIWRFFTEGSLGGTNTPIRQGKYVVGMKYNPPSNPLKYGGATGGILRTCTIYLYPAEDNPTLASRMGMETASSFVPVLHNLDKVIYGETVSGMGASRLEAGGWLLLEVGPAAYVAIESRLLRNVKNAANWTVALKQVPELRSAFGGTQVSGRSILRRVSNADNIPLPIPKYPWQYSKLPRGCGGITSPQGEVHIAFGQDPITEAINIRHEYIHYLLSAKGAGGNIHTMRQNIGQWFYDNSVFMRVGEEFLAQSYATRNIIRGANHPLSGAYSLAPGYGDMIIGGAAGTCYVVIRKGGPQ